MCTLLEDLEDTVMYRSTDQFPCIWQQFYNYAVLGEDNDGMCFGF